MAQNGATARRASAKRQASWRHVGDARRWPGSGGSSPPPPGTPGRAAHPGCASNPSAGSPGPAVQPACAPCPDRRAPKPPSSPGALMPASCWPRLAPWWQATPSPMPSWSGPAALSSSDQERLPAAAEALDAAGCRFQSARTVVLAGGDHAIRGAAALADLGLAPMAPPWHPRTKCLPQHPAASSSSEIVPATVSPARSR
jgi:hypothetical protein